MGNPSPKKSKRALLGVARGSWGFENLSGGKVGGAVISLMDCPPPFEGPGDDSHWLALQRIHAMTTGPCVNGFNPRVLSDVGT